MAEVIIRHPRSGEEYGIDSADFRSGKHYQQPDGERVSYVDAGFRVVSNIDGTEYRGPLTESRAARSAPAAAPAEKAEEAKS